MPIIVFDTDYIGDIDQFIRVVRSMDGYLLRFTMVDGTVIDGMVRSDRNEPSEERLIVELWDANDILREPVCETVDLAEVAEVYYY